MSFWEGSAWGERLNDRRIQDSRTPLNKPNIKKGDVVRTSDNMICEIVETKDGLALKDYKLLSEINRPLFKV